MKPSKLFLISLLLLIAYSCAPVRPRIPEYTGNVNSFIEAASNKFDSMNGALSIKFKKRTGQKMNADAVADITPDGISVRFYQMGMLVGDLDTLAGSSTGYEVYEEVFKKALMWWQISGYRTEKSKAKKLPGAVILSTGNRRLVLAARTYVPVSQTISLPDSDAVITYSDYRSVDGAFWYPFNIRVLYRGNSLELGISRISLTHS
ncbi:MAG: hypothetical protein M0Z61_18435 [Nitrospiraceae bacterium]|nr:hypothetical protein [Nitrospiraceae bacterium]